MHYSPPLPPLHPLAQPPTTSIPYPYPIGVVCGCAKGFGGGGGEESGVKGVGTGYITDRLCRSRVAAKMFVFVKSRNVREIFNFVFC